MAENFNSALKVNSSISQEHKKTGKIFILYLQKVSETKTSKVDISVSRLK
jgi:hypothetical protein